MMNLSKRASVFVMMLATVSLLNAAATIQAEDKIFEGSLVRVDANARTLTVQAADKEMEFAFDEQTQVVGPEQNGQTVVRQGSRLKVHYKENEKINMATRIEVAEQ